MKDICRDLGISNATFCQWRSKYPGREASDPVPYSPIEFGKSLELGVTMGYIAIEKARKASGNAAPVRQNSDASG